MRNIIDRFILAGSDGPSELNAGLSRRDSQVARAESYLRYIDRQRSNRARLRSNSEDQTGRGKELPGVGAPATERRASRRR